MNLLGNTVMKPGEFLSKGIILHILLSLFCHFKPSSTFCDDSPLGMPGLPKVKLIFGGNKSFMVINPIYPFYNTEVPDFVLKYYLIFLSSGYV